MYKPRKGWLTYFPGGECETIVDGTVDKPVVAEYRENWDTQRYERSDNNILNSFGNDDISNRLQTKFYLEALTFLEQVFFYEKEIADFLCVVEILKVKTK